MEFVTRITQNGECIATGVILTNRLAPGFEVKEALLSAGLAPDQYRIEINTNVVTVRFAEIPPQTSVDLIVKAIPHCREWFTNSLSVVRGLDTWTSCTQSGYITGPLGGGSLRLAISPSSTNAAWKITVRGGQGYCLNLRSSHDLKSWTTIPQPINPDRDPYEIYLELGPVDHQFFQLRNQE